MSNGNTPPAMSGEAQITPKQMVDSKLAVNRELLAALRAEKKRISGFPTPKPHVKSRPDGLDYVEEKYMRDQLNEHFPIWSWEIKKYEVLGDVEIIVHGRLTIIDHGVERHFDAIAAHRIASNQKGYVDLGNDLKAANSDAFKVAVNRLCNVADDIYRKIIPDLNLTTDQKESLSVLLDGLDGGFARDIKTKIKDMSKNSTNYEATVRKLKAMKQREKESNGISK